MTERKETKLYFSTKFWLTKGVQEIHGALANRSDHLIAVAPDWGRGRITIYHWLGKECFETREEAITDAKKKQVERLKAILKTLKRVEELRFE